MQPIWSQGFVFEVGATDDFRKPDHRTLVGVLLFNLSTRSKSPQVITEIKPDQNYCIW